MANSRGPRPRRAAIVLISATILLLSTVSAAQDERPVLTLAQAVADALAHNDRMVNQQDAIEQAELAVRVARNVFRPKIVPNVLGSFGQTDVSNQTYRVDLSQRLATGTEMRMGIGTSTAQIPSTTDPSLGADVRFYNADTTLTLSQPLLRGFGPSVTLRSVNSAEMRRADARRQRALGEQQIAVEVAAAYYRVIGQQALVDVAQQSLARSRKLLEASQAKLEAGLVSQLDVYRAQQLVSQGEIQLADSEAAVDDALDQLGFLIGREPDLPFAVAGGIPQVAEPAVSMEEAAALALATRPDLQSAMAAMADADRAISFARNQLRPQVDLNLALTRRETADSLADSFGFNRFQFATFFNISMPVDRTPQVVEYQNAIIDRDRRRRELDTLRKRITADVRRSVRETDRMAQHLRVAEATVDVSRKEVEVAQFRYERGLSNNLDVVTAEGDVLTAESRRISALADLAIARLNLRATIGILNPQTEFAGPTAGRNGSPSHD